MEACVRQKGRYGKCIHDKIHVWVVQREEQRLAGCPLMDCGHICPASRRILAGMKRNASEFRRNGKKGITVRLRERASGDSTLRVGGVR